MPETTPARKKHPQRPLETNRARTLRRTQTKAELELWMRLRGGQLAGHKFRRQSPIPPYYADFCCLGARLIVELDGGQHFEQHEEDEKRTAVLEHLGFKVIRFTDVEVLTAPDAVLEVVLRELEAREVDGTGGRCHVRGLSP